MRHRDLEMAAFCKQPGPVNVPVRRHPPRHVPAADVRCVFRQDARLGGDPVNRVRLADQFHSLSFHTE